jgi:PAS domain S-box-containing protein
VFEPEKALDLLKLHSDWLWSVDASGILTEWTGNNGASSARSTAPWISYLRRDSETRDGLAKLLAAIRHRKPFHCVKISCLLPHAGVRGWVKLSGIPAYDEQGCFTGYRGAALNMTGQMMAERKMGRLNSQVSTLVRILDSSPVGILMAAPRGNVWHITYANQAAASMYGDTAEHILDRDLLFMCGQKTSSGTLEQINSAIQQMQNCQIRVELHQRDGTPFWADLTLLHGGREEDGGRVIALLRDASLEVARAATEQQRDRLQALGRLAGGMAHEINNLLQPARLYSEMLGDELPSNSMGHEFLRDICTGLDQISSIVKNTLQFSRQDDKQGEATTAPVGLMLRDSLSYLSGLFPPAVEISCEGVECELPIHLKRTELTQVLGNLLINATQAMDSHGQIRIQLYPVNLDGVKVASHGLPHGLYVRLNIIDSGCGMDEATVARVFEPFFTTKPPGEGTGLGLSVVYGLITDWGGDIRVTSKVGQGTTFSILIPVVAALQNKSNPNQGEKNEYKENSVGR